MRHLSVCTVVGAVVAAAALTAGSASAEPDSADATTAPSASETSAPAPSASETSAPTATATATAPTAEPDTSTAPSSTGSATATPATAPAAGSHQVTYTVTTTSDLTANIYYVSADPPDQGSANDPKFMPMARTMVGPGAPWTFATTLDDATRWAFVSASGGLRVNPEFRCEIAVDGQVVVSQQGGSGVQCSLRAW